jgi:hypothetical protein
LLIRFGHRGAMLRCAPGGGLLDVTRGTRRATDEASDGLGRLPP